MEHHRESESPEASRPLKRAKFDENVSIECNPKDIFNEWQYLKENKKLIFDTSDSYMKDPEFFTELEKLQEEIQLLRFREIQLEKEKMESSPRLFKKHIYDSQDLTSVSNKDALDATDNQEVLLYLLTRLGEKIHQNLEAMRNSLDDVRTITPIGDLTCTEDSRVETPRVVEKIIPPNDDEVISVITISDDESRQSSPTYPPFSPKYSPVSSDSASLAHHPQTSSPVAIQSPSPSPCLSYSPINFPEDQQKVDTSLKIVRRDTWANVECDENSILQMVPQKQIVYGEAGAKRQAFMLFIITKVIRLLESKSYQTKRDLYYHSLHFCKSKPKKATLPDTPPCSEDPNQHHVSQTDSGCSRIHLNITVQSKGLVYGNLKFEMGEEIFDCYLKTEAVQVPNARGPIQNLESDADFILVVEKDAILQRLIDRRITNKFKVILFTARGYPDWNSRSFLRFLWLKLKLPTLILTDADPWGIEIACVYRFGSLTLAYESLNTALPHAKWLGLLPSDTRVLNNADRLPLTATDRKRLNLYLERPYIKKNKQYADQLRIMKELDYKVEIEGIYKKGDDDNLLRYLSNKIRHGSWI